MRAPDLEDAIAVAERTGLRAHRRGSTRSTSVRCEQWLDSVEAGNAYVNRGTTGAVVNRQPFGGWKRSAVGPTAKAGGPNYVASLRDWAPPTEALPADEVERWWQDVGGRARDLAGLSVERNLVRLRRLPSPVLVRIDADTPASTLASVRRLAARTRTPVVLSAAASRGADTEVEDLAAVTGRIATGSVSRVRWLSAEDPGVMPLAAVEAGVGFDRRPLARAVAVEGPRWMHEQSVCVTAHRYGNVGAGPQPRVPGGE